MKPTLIIGCGFGWAASSPLAYTLQRSNKYAHGGYQKNLHYLKALLEPNTPYGPLRRTYNKILFNTLQNHGDKYGHGLNTDEDFAPLKGFPKKHISNMVQLPYTIDKYINYYKALWEQVKPYGYKAVADHMAAPRAVVPVADELHKHFDLRVLLITRDPIRRAVAMAKKHHFVSPERGIIQNDRIQNIESFFEDYIKIYSLLKDKIPNTHMIIMEDLWEDDGTEKELLSTFLGYRIDNLWTNLYSPDTGHLLTWDLENTYCPTPCQVWGQSLFHLKEDYYNELREQFKHHYDSWIDTFGSLPNNWGVSIY